METNKTHFEIIPALLQEMEMEAQTTRKMLALVPDDQLDYRPHGKSMKMRELAAHLAEIPSWVDMALNTEGIDFSKGYEPTPCQSNAELMAIFEKSYASGHAALEKATEPQLYGRWVMRNGEHILADLSKYETIRHSFAQTTHHRAQLGVYLRLLNIAIPGSYGPSADEMNF